MTRAFIRAVVISAIGGLAIAPALASAADGTPTTTKTPTVTTLTTPKAPQADQEITLVARVGVHADPGNGDPGGPGSSGPEHGKPGRGETQAKGGHSGKGSADGGTRKGKGKTKTKGKKKHKGAGRHHTGETGTVTFAVDGKALRPVPLSHDRASEMVELPSGSHTITAVYGGDDNFSPSQATPLTFTVN